MGIKIERVVYETVEAGIHPAIVADIEETTGDYGVQLKWRFELLAPDMEGRKLTGWCSALLSPKSKLNRWATAVLGAAMPTDGVLDTDDLVNQKVRLDVTEEPGKDGAIYNKVRDVLPWKTQRPQPAASQRLVQPVRTTSRPPVDDYDRDPTPEDEAAAFGDTSSIID